LFETWFPATSVQSQSHFFCNKANAAIRRSLWADYQYDEALTGLEDLHMAKRLHENGYQIAYAADASIVHVHDETYPQIYNRYRREAIALKQIMPSDTFALSDFFRLLTANVLNDLFHAAKERVFLQHAASIVMCRVMQFWGNYRGASGRTEISADLRRRFYYPHELIKKGDAFESDQAGKLIDYTAPDGDQG